jgi:hypothetical protein
LPIKTKRSTGMNRVGAGMSPIKGLANRSDQGALTKEHTRTSAAGWRSAAILMAIGPEKGSPSKT